MRALRSLPAGVALLYVIPAAVYWYAQLGNLPEPMSPALAGVSQQALHAIVLAQALGLCLFVPLSDRDSVGRPGDIVMSLAPAWPLLAMFGLASGVAPGNLAATEAAVAMLGLAVAGMSALLRRMHRGEEEIRLVVTSAGVMAAGITWSLRNELLQVLVA